MSHLKRLWVGMLTRQTPESVDTGTDSPIMLIIDGKQIPFPKDTSQEDQEKGQANLYEFAVEDLSIEPGSLTNSSIRVVILGGDAWRPEHFVVWGERLTGGSILPLAMETDITTQLSTEAGEGPSFLPLRLVGLGNSTMPINRLLLMVTTATSEDSGTDDAMNLRITNDGGQVEVDFDVPPNRDTSQEDLETGQANLYFIPVSHAFTKNRLADNSIRLTTRGEDAWIPASFFLFGLDDAAGRPEGLVPLVHLRSWPFGPMSTNSSEGDDSIVLPRS